MRKKIIFGVALLILVTAGLVYFFREDIPDETEKVSGALNALQQWNLQRAYPGETIPDAAYSKATAFVKQASLKKMAAPAEVAPWKTMGPHNMGGRMLAVVFNPQNPNTIFAGSASGGLWRSRSAGVGSSAWEYVPTGFPVLGVSAIAIAPDDSNTIFIGTGEVYNYQAAGSGAAVRVTRGTYGIGILKTTDGGLTWTPCLDWSYNQQHGIWAIRINPQNPQTVWAATTEGTYKSLNAGRSWTKVHDVIMANDLVISPKDTNIVIVSCGNLYSTGHGIYRTTNSGNSWKKAANGIPQRFGGKALLAISPSTPEVIYASIGNSHGVENATWLCMSMDSGETWNIMSTEDYSQWQGWFAHDVAVDPTFHLNIITVGIDVWKSNSGGMKMEQKSIWYMYYYGDTQPGEPEGELNYSHADHHDVIFHPVNPNIIYFANDGGVFRSLDGGETFEGCNGGLQTTQFYNGFSCSQQDSLLAMGGLQDNGTVIYRGNTAWDKWRVGGDGAWTGIAATSDNLMFASSQYLNLSKSSDRGFSWRRLSLPGSTNNTTFIAPYVLGVENPQVIYAGREYIYKSMDGGTNWSVTNNGAPIDGNPVFLMDISQQSNDVVYAATAPVYHSFGIYVTRDGGKFWKDITATLPDRYPGDICVHPGTDSVVYISFSGFGTSHVFKSDCFGETWENIGLGLPDLPTSAVTVDPQFPDNIYVGNDMGVFVSRDGGLTWDEFLDGLPDAVIVTDLDISPSNRMLRVATHGNGAYERTLLDGLPPASVPSETAVSGPKKFQLEQNYPNPFNAATRISYTLPARTTVSLKIVNLLGQQVKGVVVNQVQEAGVHSVIWDGTNEAGSVVAAGTYIYQLTAGKKMVSHQMIFVK